MFNLNGAAEQVKARPSELDSCDPASRAPTNECGLFNQRPRSTTDTKQIQVTGMTLAKRRNAELGFKMPGTIKCGLRLTDILWTGRSEMRK